MLSKNIDTYTKIVYNCDMKDKKERHNISITSSTWNLANYNANKLGLSVSAYLTMLINKENLF